MKRFSLLISGEGICLFFAKTIPYICFFVVALGLLLTTALGRGDLAAKVLYLAFAVIPVVVIIHVRKFDFINKSLVESTPPLRLSAQSFSHLALFFSVLYLISLCLLVGYETRPIYYFVLIAIMAGLVFLEILTTDREHTGRRGIILAQIVFLSLNLIFGQTLKLPLYFGGTDTLAHMNFITHIIEDGHLTSAMEIYQDFPLFHLFGASGTILTGMELKESYFLLTGLVSTVFIFLVYLLAKYATNNIRISLLAALFFTVSRIAILNGMYFNPRAMAAILCLMVLYFLIRGKNNLNLRIMSVFLIFPLVFMHNTALVHFSCVLLLLIMIGFLLHQRPHYSLYTWLIIFVAAFLTYWFLIKLPTPTPIENFINPPVPVTPDTPITPDTPVMPDTPTTTFWTRLTERLMLAVPSESLRLPLPVCLFRNVDYIVMAFLAILGIVSQLYKGSKWVGLGQIFALVAFVALAFTLPGPVSLFIPLFLATRLPDLLLPFVAIVMAIGILLLMQQGSINKQRLKLTASIGLGLLIVFLYSFSSVTILGNLTDLNIGKVVGIQNRTYFTEAELRAFSFIEQGGDAILYTDCYATRYFERAPTIHTVGSMNASDNMSVEGLCLVLRKGELESRGQLEFPTGASKGYMWLTHFYKAEDIRDLQATWAEGQKFFDNSAVEMYYLHQ